MTLILGMSKPEGIYLSVDYRVTNSRTRRLIDDTSVKHLQVNFPLEHTGPRALIAYTGLAILPGGTPTATWIRETLRGENELFDASMELLRRRLDRDLARLRQPLIINVFAVQGERRFLGGFSNILKTTLKLAPRFEYQMHELQEPLAFANGLGAERLLEDGHLDKMREQLHVRPRKPMDHMNLLAAINRRVAAVERTVSPYCHVAFLPSNEGDEPGPESRVFTKPGESVPFAMPMIVFGIDVSYLAEQFHEQFIQGPTGESQDLELDPTTVNKHLKRRP